MSDDKNRIFERGEWCPLFGRCPEFDEAYHSIKNQLIHIIHECRMRWGITEPDCYEQSLPDVKEIKQKWHWGISAQVIKDARFVYQTFQRGNLYYSRTYDMDPSQTDIQYLTSQMSGLAGVKEGFYFYGEAEENKPFYLPWIRVYALLGICNAGRALSDILYGRESEDSCSVLKCLSEARAFLLNANDSLMQSELHHLVPFEEQSFQYSWKQREKQRTKTEQEQKKNEPRNEWLIREAEVLEEKHPDWGIRSVAEELEKKLSKKVEYEPIGCEQIRKILSGKSGPLKKGRFFNF